MMLMEVTVLVGALHVDGRTVMLKKSERGIISGFEFGLMLIMVGFIAFMWAVWPKKGKASYQTAPLTKPISYDRSKNLYEFEAHDGKMLCISWCADTSGHPRVQCFGQCIPNFIRESR